MGICVYWSCRHVVFVKRCNCSFYLTVGNFSQCGVVGQKCLELNRIVEAIWNGF